MIYILLDISTFSFSVGLKYDTVMYELEETPIFEGLHTGPPGFKFIKFPNIYKTMTFENLKVCFAVTYE